MEAHLSPEVTDGKRVLVVDDEPEPLRATARVLRRAGYLVTTAEDGATASEMMTHGPFDAVVSDISMPQMDGIALLRHVREHSPDLPVILITGVPAIETAVQALDHGAYKYLVKPLDPDRLVEVTAKAVRLSAARRGEVELPPQSNRTFPSPEGLRFTYSRIVDGLRMAFQPILTREGTLFGHEALMRVDHPRDYHPVTLLELARSLNRLVELGRIARRYAAKALKRSDAVGDLFVNLHPSELHDEELLAPDGALTKLAPRVVLEVTERSSVNDVTDLKRRVDQLREAGYRIAIDDLGSGYAGLTSFVLLEPDIVKLDMSLVRDVHRHAVKQRLIRSVTTLCRDMGSLVVAEGVETVAERETLMDLGCDLYQGFLFARPGAPFPAFSW